MDVLKYMEYNIKKYTEQECLNIARKCENYYQMQLNDIEAYLNARNNGWLESYNWFKPIHTTLKYDFEIVEEEIFKFSGRRKEDLQNENQPIYKAVISKKWMYLFESIFIPVYADKGYWAIEENAYKAALQCESKEEFYTRYTTANSYAKKNNWFEKWNLWDTRHSPGSWTYEKVAEEAAKYEFRGDFNKSYASKIAIQNGWYRELTKDMKITKNISSARIYCVYIYLIEEYKTAYVGLTKNIIQRDRNHQFMSGRRNEDLLPMFCADVNVAIPKPIILYENLTAEEAARLETNTYYEYKNNGWEMLNSEHSLGFLGGYSSYKYTKKDEKAEERNISEKERIETVAELNDKPKRIHRGNYYWTRERIEAEAKLYKTLKEFHDHSGSAYAAAKRYGFLNEIADKYNLVRSNNKPAGYWNKEMCYAESLKYTNRNDFMNGSPTAYDKSMRNKWLDEWPHMKTQINPTGYWTYERCYEEALKYKTKNDFRHGCPSAYSALKRMKALTDFNGFWTGNRKLKKFEHIILSESGQQHLSVHPDAFSWMTEEQKYK